MSKVLTNEQVAWRGGYQPGSVCARMTTEQRRAFWAWLKERNADQRAFELTMARVGAICSRDRW